MPDLRRVARRVVAVGPDLAAARRRGRAAAARQRGLGVGDQPGAECYLDARVAGAAAVAVLRVAVAVRARVAEPAAGIAPVDPATANTRSG